MPEQDIAKETLALVQETNRLVKKVERHLYWSRIFSGVYIVLIVTPIVLAIIYLPPILQPYIERLDIIFKLIPIKGQSS